MTCTRISATGLTKGTELIPNRRDDFHESPFLIRRPFRIREIRAIRGSKFGRLFTEARRGETCETAWPKYSV